MTYVRVIFDQWPKLNLGFDVEPEIRILKVIYCVFLSVLQLFATPIKTSSLKSNLSKTFEIQVYVVCTEKI